MKLLLCLITAFSLASCVITTTRSSDGGKTIVKRVDSNIFSAILSTAVFSAFRVLSPASDSQP